MMISAGHCQSLKQLFYIVLHQSELDNLCSSHFLNESAGMRDGMRRRKEQKNCSFFAPHAYNRLPRSR